MSEVWKDIPGYEGIYQVSSYGRVKSLARTIKSNRCVYPVKERILKQNLNKQGYPIICLTKEAKCKTCRIHQLVAIAFLNHTPCGYKLVVNHKDFNPKNNRLENLEIVTARENANLKHIKSSSKYVGVSWFKAANKWSSYIKINGKKKHLGYFTNEEEASEAYQTELKRINNEP